jgi:pyridoxal phosphate enzyme (YggS family)
VVCDIISVLNGSILPSSLKNRLEEIKLRIKRAAEKSGRLSEAVCLVAVTKNVSLKLIKEAIALGVQDIGENRVQEAMGKMEQIPRSVKRHFIGSLQTNKARKAIELFDLIQSVDRLKLALSLDRLASERGRPQECLIEVKIVDEPLRGGVPFVKAGEFIKEVQKFSHLVLRGLMTIAPMGPSLQETKSLFKQFSNLFILHRDAFGENPILSMGMTDDFEGAIEQGSTMVRIGRGLFGERNL